MLRWLLSKKLSDCELIKGCYEPGYGYRCQSGHCVSCVEECTDDKTLGICSNDTVRSEDGICRKECPEYNGCALKTQTQCANGFCVMESSQCLTKDQSPALCVLITVSAIARKRFEAIKLKKSLLHSLDSCSHR